MKQKMIVKAKNSLAVIPKQYIEVIIGIIEYNILNFHLRQLHNKTQN